MNKLRKVKFFVDGNCFDLGVVLVPALEERKLKASLILKMHLIHSMTCTLKKQVCFLVNWLYFLLKEKLVINVYLIWSIVNPLLLPFLREFFWMHKLHQATGFILSCWNWLRRWSSCEGLYLFNNLTYLHQAELHLKKKVLFPLQIFNSIFLCY